ncbi:unnamed protein product [Symbiodinium sp. CCMP2592]|nr:unnamed protein product [Symbiodinium sp. CCMP2592]
MAVEISGITAASALPVGLEEQTLLRGTVCERNEASNFGFLRCPQVQDLCGKDVFFCLRDFPDWLPGMSVAFRLVWDDIGRPRAAPEEAEPSNTPRRDQVEVALGPEFGPLGLGLRCGWLPEVGHIREDRRSFWLGQGVRVGDRLLELKSAKEAVSLEDLAPGKILPRLCERPLRLVFLCLHDEV